MKKETTPDACQKNIETLRKDLILYNEAYRAGNPLVSDSYYDHRVELLRLASPNDEFFQKGIVEEKTDRMEKLPVPMYSLEKIKTIKEFRKWLTKMSEAGAKRIVATPKFDGISLVAKDDRHAWTRGDGVEGQRSDSHFFEMTSGVTRKALGRSIISWGEAIIKKKTFAHLKDDQVDFPYKNARNMVAGLFNSPDGWKNPYLPAVDFVRYGADMKGDKIVVLETLRNLYKNSTPYIYFDIERVLDLDDEDMNMLLDEGLHDKFDDEYKIDGVVIEVDEHNVREQLGRLPNGNPAFAIAFKKDEWCEVYQTKVISIEKGVGKTGVLNPVIIIDPVEINGATVARATAYNAAYLIDQHICEGAIIEVTRGGDVIPKHLKTIDYNEGAYVKMMDDLIICPSCGKLLKWNDTHVDLICSNESCKEKVISSMVYFFRTMGCEEFEEPTIRRLHQFGYKTIDTILESHVAEFQNLLGKSKGKTVANQIQRVLGGVPLARYLTAINIFDGKIAETTCQKILDGLDYEMMERLKFPNEYSLTAETAVKLQRQCEGIPGIGSILAHTFVKGLHKYLVRGKDRRVVITYVQTPKIEVPEGIEPMYVCMTGFRNKGLEKVLKEKGHVVLKGVTLECTVLVVADINSTSSKMETAKKRGLRIVTREDFENEVLLQG